VIQPIIFVKSSSNNSIFIDWISLSLRKQSRKYCSMSSWRDLLSGLTSLSSFSFNVLRKDKIDIALVIFSSILLYTN